MKSNYLYFNTAQAEAILRLFENQNLVAELKWEAGRSLSATLEDKVGQILKTAGIKKEALAGVVVFPGPGSFTGLRIGLSFANALAFGLHIPVFLGDEKGRFECGKPLEFAEPLYGAEPHITEPKKKL